MGNIPPCNKVCWSFILAAAVSVIALAIGCAAALGMFGKDNSCWGISLIGLVVGVYLPSPKMVADTTRVAANPTLPRERVERLAPGNQTV